MEVGQLTRAGSGLALPVQTHLVGFGDKPTRAGLTFQAQHRVGLFADGVWYSGINIVSEVSVRLTYY